MRNVDRWKLLSKWHNLDKMGLTQSSRKITITNDDDTKLITLSSALVERLAQGTLDDSSSASRNAAAASTTVPVTSTAPERQPYNPPPVNPRSETYERFPHEYTLSALQMQQQKEMELQDQELYWQNRLQNLEKNHVLINQIFDAEHKKAVDEFVNKKGQSYYSFNIFLFFTHKKSVL